MLRMERSGKARLAAPVTVGAKIYDCRCEAGGRQTTRDYLATLIKEPNGTDKNTRRKQGKKFDLIVDVRRQVFWRHSKHLSNRT
jgi:hypothetical protein